MCLFHILYFIALLVVTSPLLLPTVSLVLQVSSSSGSMNIMYIDVGF